MKNININKKLPVPIYHQIREQILERIKSGELAVKDRLPAELELANSCGISPMTVRQAYTSLVNEGFLYRRHGKGTFVSEAPAPKAVSGNEKNSTDIGFICSSYSSFLSFRSKLLLGVEDACRKYSFKIHMIATNEMGINPEDNFILSNLLSSKQLDALIVVGSLTEEDIGMIKSLVIPFVLVDHDYKGQDVLTVLTEDEKFVELSFRKLLREGKSRIALLSGPLSRNPRIFPRRGDKLIKAYKESLSKAGLKFKDSYVKTSEIEDMSAFKAAMQLLEDPDRPEAVLVNGDLITKSLLRAAEKKNMSVPGDLSILNYGDSQDSPCNFISKPLFEMGKTAVELLKKSMNDVELKTKRTVVPLET
ncbi:MAG TPA: hypothetical protein DCZ94_11170 [Lentisphaeria bacterium]|nr:MAG: hypothetical protein A2X48_07050 [Lentisphaerae bacterium GWF2_49_21]HBC87506.1 hypothetical protein [Lentisphaeria bacterium]